MDATVCHFEIPADDVDAARRFYGELFNWTINPAPGKDDYLFIRTSQDNPAALGGGIVKRPDPQHGVTLFVMVDSVEAMATKLEALGGKVLQPKTAVPRMGWTVLARDPQGNPIGLFQLDTQAG